MHQHTITGPFSIIDSGCVTLILGAFCLVFLFGCEPNTEDINMGVSNTDTDSIEEMNYVSSAEGKIQQILINFPYVGLNENDSRWTNWQSMLIKLLGSQRVIVHAYVDVSPKFFRLHAQPYLHPFMDSLSPSISSYLSWRSSLDAYIPENQDTSNINWKAFELDYELAKHRIAEEKALNGIVSDTSGFGFILESDFELNQKRKANITKLLLKIKESICPNSDCLDILVTSVDGSENVAEIPKQYDFGPIPNTSKWIQDHLWFASSDKGPIAIARMNGEYAEESILISKALLDSSFIHDVKYVSGCMDGANLMMSKSLVIATDEPKIGGCGVGESALVSELKKLFKGTPSWLSVEGDFQYQQKTARKGLPWGHMDMFLNFGITDSGSKIAFIGQADIDYYADDYLDGDGLTLLDRNYLSKFNRRLDQVEKWFKADCYETKRVPMIPVHHNVLQSVGRSRNEFHAFRGMVSFNNVIVECYQTGKKWKRSVYVPDYSNTNELNGLKTDRIACDLETAYSGFDMIYVPGNYKVGEVGSLHCNIRVISRNP